MVHENGSSNPSNMGRRWIFGAYEYVETSRTLLHQGEPLKLESKPRDVLQYLLENATRAVSKDILIGSVWGTSTSDQSVAVAVSKLREVFGGPRDSIILTIPGFGYRMAVPVTCVLDNETPPALKLKAGEPIPGQKSWIAVKHLGLGNPPTVWIAEHKDTHEAHVFKFASDADRLRALQREVVLSRVFQKVAGEHQGFVRIVACNFEDAPFFIESEYCGFNLFEFSATDEFTRMSLSERVALAAQLAETVAAAHAVGVLHNDLKPSNVLIMARQNSGWQVKVADFGVASLIDPQRFMEMDITHHGAFEGENHGSLGGTVMYRAPELLAGATPHVRGDIYALGVILYQIARGDFLEPPSPGWEAHIPDPLLREDIAEAANINPDLRFSSAASLAERLRSLDARRAEREQQLRKTAEDERNAQALARERLRRPWIHLAIATLIVALCVSLGFYHRAAVDRDLADSRNTTLSSMYGFLAEDLLNQSNPTSDAAGARPVNTETLIAAIGRVLPLIDQRFSNSPDIAGRLHETIGAALDNRTDYASAAAQFAAASECFRKAEGPQSQKAIIAELRRENCQIREMVSGSIDKARVAFQQQQILIGRLPVITPELQAWQALTQAALLAFSAHPEEGIPVLKNAVRRAEATPGFNSSLLLTMKSRFCGIYIKMNDGPNLERAARDVIATLTSLHGASSPTLFNSLVFLEESFYLQHDYKKTITQGDQNYAQFVKVLGPANQLTMASLVTRANAEALLEDYSSAIRDLLTLHEAEKSIPSGAYIGVGTLSDAAMYECRSGRFQSGKEHARQAIQLSSDPAQPQPLFANGSTFTIAECLIAQQETAGSRPNVAALNQADTLLARVNLPLIAQTSGSNDYEGMMHLAKARLALLRGQPDIARDQASKAAPILNNPSADPYEHKILAKVKAELETRYARP